MLERRFKAVPGVIDVSGWGGKTKTYDVDIDQHKLLSYGISLQQVLQIINNSNVNVGGQTVNIGPQAAVVRGVALIHSMDQLRNTMLASVNGAPVFLKDVARVEIGHQPRLGIAGQDDDDDIVQGIVLMRRGAQSKPTIRAVEAEVAKINTTGVLPPGVHIERIYDRTSLIDVTTNTVLHNMIMGMILIFLIQWMFLGDLKSALIVATTIPFALFFAVIIMVVRGESANLLSVGAIDFGLVVDATVIMVENIFRHLSEAPSKRFQRFAASAPEPVGAGPSRQVRADRQCRAGGQPLDLLLRRHHHRRLRAAFHHERRRRPHLRPHGAHLRLCHCRRPDRDLHGFAGAVGPAAAGRMSETETVIVRFLRKRYQPVIEFALDNRIFITRRALVAAADAALRFSMRPGLGIPAPSRGRQSLDPRNHAAVVSLEESDRYVNRMRRMMQAYPEVDTVVSQHGRPDDGTDATGFFNAEFFVPLKPFDTWPRGVDKAKLTEHMTQKLQDEFPGVDFNFSQYIEDNVEEAASGVKGENSVKLYGNDLEALEKAADEIKDVMAKVPGIVDLAIFNSLGQPTVKIDIDREHAARYGLAPGDINATVQAAIGGQAAGNLYEDGSDRNFPIMVRLAPQYRQSLDAIRRITDRRAQSERQRRHSHSAVGRGKRQAHLGRLLHLSREPGTLHSDQVQRPRPRSRQRGPGSAAENRAERAPALGDRARMGRRVRRIAGSRGATCHGRSRSASCSSACCSISTSVPCATCSWPPALFPWP